jgi:hypothetical protein
MKKLFKTIDEAESSVLVLINAKTDLTTRFRLRQLTKAERSARSGLTIGLETQLLTK